ncbi:GNAT family N-acetyltransferase [Umezawaea endophytica]|uniref:GNAT family N-acetyltransferase n=1 Tax=Umezawaea endophytica TaxID=1654476 RepID=A0A9X2VPP1_9PSEU|nr:GNAT family N-acetyltransferase [Umezawaea endophytica]MCS7480543.1 GNAT family N-acetyltransferase [Umezawaea endophytica]
MTVRTAGPADLNAFVASAAALFAEDGGTRDPHMDQSWPARHGHEYYGAAIADPDVLCLVAVDGDEVVGHLLGRLKGPNPVRPSVVGAELESVRVADDHRGSGVGGELNAAFVAWAGERGVTEVTVHAFASNTAAIRFYESHGYVPGSLQLRLPVG